jgi:hypothetical protein
LRERLGPGDPFGPYYEQLFLVAGEYDVSPLVRLLVAVAEIKGVEVGEFVRKRAARSSGDDTKGVWKPALHGRTPAEVASRLHFAFARYFPPCTGDPIRVEERRFDGELRGLPACMNGLYASSTIGFYEGALRDVGALDVDVAFERPESDGMTAGIPLERLRFTVRWRE